jgi:hypothetical protein
MFGVALSLPAQPAYPSAGHGGNYMHNYYFPPAPSSTPWAPAWSPDQSRIAVAMSGSIWEVNPATGNAREITYGEKYHSLPTWSPDGRWIAYTADDGGRTIQLELLDVESGESHTLTDDEFIYTDPVFSPDGTRLAYVSTRPNGYFNIYVRPIANGRWAGPEISITRDNDFGRSRLYFGRWDMHITPSWLPDGDSLLIVSNRDQPLGSGNVLRVPVRENGIEDARPALSEQTLYRTRPDVSIDGKRFVYSSTMGTADQFNNLYVQPTAGGEPYKLTFFTHDAFHPRWSPDGEWIAYIANEGGLPQLSLLETYGGAQRTLTIASREWKRPTGTLALRVADDASGAVTAARIHLIASDGKFYAPFDAYARVGFASDHLFHASDAFEVVLPPGQVRVTAVKGFEFWPDTAAFEIRAGEVTRGTLRLRRVTDLSTRGWFSGSTHVHTNYAGNLHNTLENVMMMSAAEDQDVVNELIANKDNRILDHHLFLPGGRPHPISQPDRLLVVGQEYRPPFYGHVFMLGLRDHLISPFVTGYEGTAIESLYPSNTDMFRKAKRQGATVGYVHPYGGDSDPLEGNLGGGKGFMVDAALGTTDALEWSGSNRASFFPLYAVWNNGLRVTATGGEDSISDLQRSKLVGSVRTYVCTDERGLTMDGWFEGLRSGRAFVSSGPLIEVSVNDRIAGGDVALPAAGGTVEVLMTVRSITPLERIEVVYNGRVVDTVLPAGARRTVDYRGSFRVTQSGWFHVRAEGDPAERFPLDVDYAQAFTNPVWITVGNRPIRSRPAAEYGIRWIDKLQQLAEAWPGWRSERERQHVFDQFEEARQVYRRLGAEAPAEPSDTPAVLQASSTDSSVRSPDPCWR